MLMTDIHAHILHETDDGPAEISDSIKLIETLSATGVKRVAATSHYYAAVEFMEEYVENRDLKIAEIREALDKKNVDIEIFTGAEVLMDRLILNLKDISGLCYNGGKHILLEIPHADADYREYVGLIERIMSYYNVIPVVAHVERYPYFSRCVKNVEYLKDMGCMVQLDAQCFFDTFKLKHFGYTLLKKGLADVVGSDCHDLKLRCPNLHSAYEVIGKKMGKDTVDLLKYNADCVIK